MSDVLYLAWRYLTYHRMKTAVLVASITTILYLPLGLNILINQSARQLRGRAHDTPLLVGAKGSPLELVLRSLYFESTVPESVPYGQTQLVESSGLAAAIPIHARYETRFGPIIGTRGSYFEFRGLTLARGRPMTTLGECVIGSQLARVAKLEPGDSILSSDENVFDIGGAYPLKMKIAGVLQPSDSPDDKAVFVDLKTTWIIEGLGHGHQNVSQAETESGQDHEGSHTGAVLYNEITPENVESFHFHGDQATFPVTAIIALPKDEKSSVLLEGRYLEEGEEARIVRPAVVTEDLLTTIFTVGRYITIAAAIVGLTTLATTALVFWLSLQLRKNELRTMAKIGGSRARINSIVAAEILGVLCSAIILAVLLALATSWLATGATRWFLQFS